MMSVASTKKAKCRTIILGKIGYAGVFMGLGSTQPFLSLLIASKGFSPLEIGLLSAAAPIFMLLGIPYLSNAIDRYRCERTALSIMCFLSFLLLSILQLAESKAISAVVFLGFVASLAAVAPLYDHYALTLLTRELLNSWGNMRVVGTVTWGLWVPLTAALLSYGWVYIVVMFGVGQLTVVFVLFFAAPQEEVERSSIHLGAVCRMILRNSELRDYLIMVCCMGAGIAIVTTYLFLFLYTLGGSKLLMGLSVSAAIAFEIPLMHYGSWLLHKLSCDKMLIVALLCWVVRAAAYSVLQNPWLVLFIEPLHGISFALTWISAISAVPAAFEPSLQASAVGTLHATMFGLGPLLGNVIAGLLYEYSPRIMFRVCSVVMLFATIRHALKYPTTRDQSAVAEEGPRNPIGVQEVSLKTGRQKTREDETTYEDVVRNEPESGGE